MIHISPNFCIKAMMLLFPLPKYCWNGLMCLLAVTKISRSIVVFAASAHRPFCRYVLNFPLSSITHTQLKRVVNFWLTQPVCCGIPWAVYSKLNPSPSCLKVYSKAWFSPALLQWRYCTCKLYLSFKFLIKSTIALARLEFSFKKKLQI